MKRVRLIYNTDYDEELIASSGVDVSAVEEAAQAVRQGIADHGFETEIIGIHGRDISEVLSRMQDGKADLVFNIVESLCGDTRNELVVPALLELLNVPYTGPNALAIGLCLHKVQCKHVLTGCGIPTPDHLLLPSAAELAIGRLDEDIAALEYPFFLKLAREDASIGIEANNVVSNAAELRCRGAELLAQYGQPVLCERYVVGREVNVTVLGNGEEIEVLPLYEIDFGLMPEGRPHIISYAAKWDEEHVEYGGTTPVPMKDISPELEARISDVAKRAFTALGLRDFGRVDLRVDAEGIPWVIDVNPNCDLSPGAGVANAAALAGMDYPQLIGRICELAWSRYERTTSKS
ncbi:MAG: ATP-grasp domain-containing protein [Myxococcales bacterium]|nr:ATP-grasp domain-containing protein [Myxococcales bacterium]